MTRVGIAGAGAWGLALALAARRAGSEPVLWSRRGPFAAEDLSVAGDPAVLGQVDMLLFVCSAQELHSVAAYLAPHLATDLPLAEHLTVRVAGE